MITLYDSVEVDKPHMTRDGYLVAEARVARTGIQVYLAKELGLDEDPSKQIRVYRPPEEVFSQGSMSSYAFRPVTVDHPSELVDASNWKEHARGQTGGEILRDGEFVRVPLVLMDGSAIDEWKNGKRELSMGYTMELEIKDGVTPQGESYDAVQRNLRMNHLALVSRARGGSQLKLGDDKPEDSSMSDVKLTTVTVDGLSVQTTDAGAQAIGKLQGELNTARDSLRQEQESHRVAIAAKDKELATKDATIEDLKSKVLDEAAIDKRVRARADLISKATSIVAKDYTGMSDDDIRKTAVSAKLGQNAVDGKSVEYVNARFDILVEDVSQDPVRAALRTGVNAADSTGVEKAHAGMISHLQNAWKGEEAQ